MPTKDKWDGQLSLFDDDSSREAPLGKSIVVFDVETQRSFKDVGGRAAFRQLGISVAIAYSFQDDVFLTFYEREIDKLADLLRSSELIIGYNLLGFDYEVVKGYVDFPFETLPTLDLMVDLQGKLGFRPKLDSVVQATLGAAKSADGLQALAWWKEGRIDLIEKYCTEDVRLTRDLFLFGRRNRHVLVAKFSGAPHRVDVSW